MQKELAAIRGDLEKIKTEEVIKRHGGREKHRAFHKLKENHQNHVVVVVDDDREYKDKKKTLVVEELETAFSGTVQPISLGKQLQKEKRLLLHRMKEKHQAQQGKTKDRGSSKMTMAMATNTTNNNNNNSSNGVRNVKRSSPLHEITNNSSPLMKQSSRAIFPLL